jgi:hypothetical protein
MKIVFTLMLTFAVSNTFATEYKKASPLLVISKNNNQNQSENLLNVALISLSEGINPKAFNKAWKTEGTKVYQQLALDCHEELKACEPLRDVALQQAAEDINYKIWKDTKQ